MLIRPVIVNTKVLDSDPRETPKQSYGLITEPNQTRTFLSRPRPGKKATDGDEFTPDMPMSLRSLTPTRLSEPMFIIPNLPIESLKAVLDSAD